MSMQDFVGGPLPKAPEPGHTRHNFIVSCPTRFEEVQMLDDFLMVYVPAPSKYIDARKTISKSDVVLFEERMTTRNVNAYRVMKVGKNILDYGPGDIVLTDISEALLMDFPREEPEPDGKPLRTLTFHKDYVRVVLTKGTSVEEKAALAQAEPEPDVPHQDSKFAFHL